MLNKRVISAIIGIPLLILILHIGGILFLLTVLLLAALGLNEFYRLASAKGVRPNRSLGLLSGLFLLTVTYLNSKQLLIYFKPELIIISILFLLLLNNLVGGKDQDKSALLDTAVTMLGILYVCGLLLYLILIYNFNLDGMQIGRKLVWLPILATWMADTAAYFTGLNFGKHKLAPNISPNKTIEGALGGIAGSLLIVLIYGSWLSIGIKERIVLGVLLAIVSQLGDLVESAFKRDAQIKDSGNIIPGHGGILDRFDSLLFTLPLVYYYFQFLVK
ncbi:phosphatidate cytidylyltransferase [Selenihalanaerobacter shriftii]|uniref:Phosphatidate cytidylyltransferase n=1 Tax=Selenihalanaerobacter shriftii TaxID=142842 RepID=A0A1T4MDJ9_9FIRM|nr:phosphatidate cytidylyltransferase [Selenihalanaerobacter shriftii]SJZ64936.1 phosphatidate cytidylyltransferase [Selenihalanaerobacter shriftii]